MKKMVPNNFNKEKIERILNLLESKKNSGKNILATCPFCYKDQKFSYSIESIHSKTGMFKCFSCDVHGNGTDLLQKLENNQSIDYIRPTYPLKSFIDDQIAHSDSKLKPFIDNGDWDYRFPILNQSGEELYVRLLKYKKGELNKKGKEEKILGFIHKAEDGIYYWGMGGRESIFYGIDKIKKNSEIVFIVEGEKKRDILEKCLNDYYQGNEFSVISPINGCNQKLDEYTLKALEDANPKKIVFIPDLDTESTKGFNFVRDNNRILSSKGFKSFIYNLREFIQEEPFDGYDIVDALESHKENVINNLISICGSNEILSHFHLRYLWDNIIPNFYGIDKIKKNSEIVFIVDGEKKKDRLEKCLNDYYQDNEFSVISPTNGSSQRIDEETLFALEFANPKKIILIPDLDSDLRKGFKFVRDNNSILLSKGFNSFIYNLREFILEEPFDGYDIYDALEAYEEVTVDDLVNNSRSDDYLIPSQQRYLWDNRKGNEISFNSPYINQSFSFNFLYENLNGYESPCLLIKSIQGTGKTTFIKEVASKSKILYISSRRSLCIEVGKILGCKDYLMVIESEKYVADACVNYSDSLAVCIDSIYLFETILRNLKDYIVIFDEVDSILNSLFLSDHILKPNNKNFIRYVYFDKLIYIINNSKMCLFMSSDIPESNVNLIQNIKSLKHMNFESLPIFHLTNLYEDKKIYKRYIQSDLFLKKIIELLSNGKKVSISVNSKIDINKLEYFLLNGVKIREIKIIKITSIKTQEGLDAIKNKDFTKYDCVIYSPTIFIGNDFNVEFSDYHFLFCTNNRTTDHYELLQSCFRFRRAKEIHFCFKTIKKRSLSTPEAIVKKIENKTKELEKKFTPILKLKENRLFVETYSELRAAKDNSLFDLENKFISLLKSRGAKIETFQDLSKIPYDFKSMSKKFGVYYKERISRLPIIACKDRLKSISNGAPASNEDEKDAFDKSQIFFHLDLRPDFSSKFVDKLVTKSSPKKVYECLRNNFVLISDLNVVIKMDKVNQDTLLTEEITKFHLKQVLQKCFRILFNLNPEELKPDTLKSIIPEEVIDSSKQAELTIQLLNDPDFIKFWKGKKGNVSYFIRNLFNDILGWGLIAKQGAGKIRTRSYRVNQEGFQLFLDAVSKKRGYLP